MRRLTWGEVSCFSESMMAVVEETHAEEDLPMDLFLLEAEEVVEGDGGSLVSLL